MRSPLRVAFAVLIAVLLGVTTDQQVARSAEPYVGVNAREIKGKACTSEGLPSPCIRFTVSGGFWPSTTDGSSPNWVLVTVEYPAPAVFTEILDEFDVTSSGGVRGRATERCGGVPGFVATYYAVDGTKPDPFTFQSQVTLPC